MDSLDEQWIVSSGYWSDFHEQSHWGCLNSESKHWSYFCLARFVIPLRDDLAATSDGLYRSCKTEIVEQTYKSEGRRCG